MKYRHLTNEEINTLLTHNCSSGNWENITVKEGFVPDNIRNTRLEGRIKLGIYNSTIELEDNASVTCGIYNSNISNCEIDDNVFISEVRNLSNYIIERNVVISNVGSFAVNKKSTFGNGTEIAVLNEAGGRELPIFDRLSAQIAYLTVLYRHDNDFISNITGLIKEYCESKRSDRGLVQTGARIIDTPVIRNVFVGSYVTVSGAALLEEGTIRGCSEDPVFIGEGVIAKKFIVLSGSRLDGSAMIEKCFVGQGVKIGKQYSAENSVFFANCEAFHGEACSLFAGPYSVTHHKSTLLIASLVSFFNAGSGTNQSNHMYKLGPLHQGILERGTKTGSYSYLLLPCHIGAYTVVVGKHYANFDTSDLPFSYISEEKGKSELTPAMNLFTVGTRRDIDKWPSRDRRKDPQKYDLIHFDLFNPFIAGNIVNAISILGDLAEKTDRKQDYVNFKGINIHRLLLNTTRKYYEIALKIYVGQELVKRIRDLDSNSSMTDLKKMLASDGKEDTGKWSDICGMLSPEGRINDLIDSVKTLRIKSIDELNDTLVSIYSNYSRYAWRWCSGLITRQTGSNAEDLPVDSVISIISDWKTNAIKLNNMILKDAEKEFDSGSSIGFGVDGDNNTRVNDFKAVRGEYDKNKFVTGLRKESMETENEANRLISVLEKFRSRL